MPMTKERKAKYTVDEIRHVRSLTPAKDKWESAAIDSLLFALDECRADLKASQEWREANLESAKTFVIHMEEAEKQRDALMLACKEMDKGLQDVGLSYARGIEVLDISRTVRLFVRKLLSDSGIQL